MNKTVKRSLAILLVMILLIFACMGIADSIQRGGGKIDVRIGTVPTPAGQLTYKLYVTRTTGRPAPPMPSSWPEEARWS